MIVTYEDHNVNNGLGSIISCMTADAGLSKRIVKFGVSGYARSGNADDVYRLAGLSADIVTEGVEKALKENG